MSWRGSRKWIALSFKKRRDYTPDRKAGTYILRKKWGIGPESFSKLPCLNQLDVAYECWRSQSTDSIHQAEVATVIRRFCNTVI